MACPLKTRGFHPNYCCGLGAAAGVPEPLEAAARPGKSSEAAAPPPLTRPSPISMLARLPAGASAIADSRPELKRSAHQREAHQRQLTALMRHRCPEPNAFGSSGKLSVSQMPYA